MVIESLLYAIAIFIGVILVELFVCQMFLLEKQTLKAYLLDLKNQNPNLLVQTKCSLVKREKVHLLKVKVNEQEIDAIVNEGFVDELMNIDKVYFDKKTNRYYVEQKNKKSEIYAATPVKEVLYYKYVLKDRDYTFNKESDNLFLNNEQVLFKNPFTGEYLWEKEKGNNEFLTEVQLMTQTPKKMDIYFFDFKEMNKIFNSANKTCFDFVGIFSLIAGVSSVLTFVLNLFL